MPENISNNSKNLIVDQDHPCWDTHGMYYREFSSDPKLIRYYTIMIIDKSPNYMREGHLLEQQVSEIIKNAIYHGNKKDKNRSVKVRYSFDNIAKIIVEDEGEGFKELDRWNKFNEERNKAFEENDVNKMVKYVAFCTKDSTEEDGGNSLFAAIEYWNMGMIYNKKKNKICAMRRFEKN